MTTTNRILKKCAAPGCPEDVPVTPSAIARSKTGRFFCDGTCKGRWMSVNLVGAAHPNHKEKIPVPCAGPGCTETKYVYPSVAKARERFFHSGKCKGNWHRIHDAGPRQGYWVECPCSGPGCKNTVPVVRSKAKMYASQFCSDECLFSWRSQQVIGDKNPNYRGGGYKKCDESNCKNETWVKPSDEDGKNFCSKECSDKFFVGENSPNWRGGLVKRKCGAPECPNEFEVKQAEAERSSASYCSKTCWGLANQSRITVTCSRHGCPNKFDVVLSRSAQPNIYCSMDCKHQAQIKQRSPEELMMRSLNRLMGTTMAMSLGGNKAGRHWETLVGYTVADLKAHLESLFKPDMTWGNRGVWKKDGPLKWHIDHARPRSSFSFSSADDPEFKKCWGLENLQPMWGPDNLAKWAHYTPPLEAAADELLM